MTKINVATIENSQQAFKLILNEKIKGGLFYKISNIIDECGKVIKKFDKDRTEIIESNGGYKNVEESKYDFKSNDDELKVKNLINEKALEIIELDIVKLKMSELEDLEVEGNVFAIISWTIDLEK